MAGEKTIAEQYVDAPITALDDDFLLPVAQTASTGGADADGNGVVDGTVLAKTKSVTIGNTTHACVAADIGKTLVLNHASAAISWNATTLGAGWWCRIWTKAKSAAYAVPSPTGGTLVFDADPAHDSITEARFATAEIIDVSSTLYVVIIGATE
jgi:hypothetical protein